MIIIIVLNDFLKYYLRQGLLLNNLPLILPNQICIYERRYCCGCYGITVIPGVNSTLVCRPIGKSVSTKVIISKFFRLFAMIRNICKVGGGRSHIVLPPLIEVNNRRYQ